MTQFWSVIWYLLYLYWIIIAARAVIETARSFARAWRPSGPAAIGIELVYTTTDPPVRALRRAVPPLRIGGVAIDLSLWILLLLVYMLRAVAEVLMF